MTFEEDFLSLGVQSLTDNVPWGDVCDIVRRNCLDKQRVQESTERISKLKFVGSSEQVRDKVLHEFIFELGLDK